MKHKRKPWFEFVKKIMRVFIKKSDFVYLGKEIDGPSIIVSNHVGTKAPLAWELYCDIPFRFWGTHEMNEGVVSLYKYLSRVFYHEKKHWNLFLARLFCIIAAPLANMFYKGLNLIATYRDSRLKRTMKESIETLQNGQSVILFPEDSTKGYLDELEGVHDGFLLLAEICLRRGVDVPIYTAYYRKNERKYIVGRPIMLSQLLGRGMSRRELAEETCAKINALGKMSSEEIEAAQNEDDNVAA